MEGSFKEAESEPSAPTRKPTFVVIKNYRDQQATVKKRKKEQTVHRKRHSRNKQPKQSSEEEESTARRADKTGKESPVKNMSATRLFEEVELEVNIPYQFKENELDEDDPFDSVQRKNSMRQIQHSEEDNNEEL